MAQLTHRPLFRRCARVAIGPSDRTSLHSMVSSRKHIADWAPTPFPQPSAWTTSKVQEAYIYLFLRSLSRTAWRSWQRPRRLQGPATTSTGKAGQAGHAINVMESYGFDLPLAHHCCSVPWVQASLTDTVSLRYTVHRQVPIYSTSICVLRHSPLRTDLTDREI